MAYAAYREHPGTLLARDCAQFYVLDVTVACSDALHVRRAVSCLQDVGVVRCEPLLHTHHACESAAPRVLLMVRLPLALYAQVLHSLMEVVPTGEVGHLMGWRAHLARCGLCHGL